MKLLRTLKKSIGHRSPVRLGWHKLKSIVAAVRYGFPARSMVIIGVTGSDGKTTTVTMLDHILHSNSYKVGALSTAFTSINGMQSWNETQKTSPSPFYVQAFLAKCKKAGCSHVVLEYSSHGLVQHRTDYSWPLVAGITNLTPEHLDYHGSMQQYRNDKGKLFTMLRKNGTKVLNQQDDTYAYYKQLTVHKTINYGIGEGVLQASIDGSTPNGTTITMNYNNEDLTFTLPIPGSFNAENALCATGCALALGLPLKQIVKALEYLKSAPGRMELISQGQPFTVIVDFTVTPGAYQKTLSTVKTMLQPNAMLHVLTGSCGDRMKEKRPEVGKICSKYADSVIVTNEDPYTEDPMKIINEVVSGVDQSVCDLQVILDRKEALKVILERAQPNDIVMLCGKGADTTMWVQSGQIPWNEREIVTELLKQQGYSNG